MLKSHSSLQAGELQAPQVARLAVESISLIGSQAPGSAKLPRGDSDFDLVFVIGKESPADVVRVLAEIPESVKRYKDNPPSQGGVDHWGRTLWEALGGERGRAHLRELGMRALEAHGFALKDNCDVDIFVATSESQGHCIRLTWQLVTEDDGESVRWEGLGFVSLGEAWQSRGYRIG